MSSWARRGAREHPEHRSSHRASPSLPIPSSPAAPSRSAWPSWGAGRGLRQGARERGQGRGCRGRAPSTAGRSPSPGHLEQPRLGDSDEAAGPPQQSHSPTWNRELKDAPATGSRAPPDAGSRPRVPGLAATRPCPWGPSGQRRAGLGCRARAIGEKRKRVGKRPRRGYRQSRQFLRPGWVLGETGPTDPRRQRGRVPLTPPAHSPAAPGRGAAAPRGRAGAAGPCLVPESPAGHRHRDGGIPSASAPSRSMPRSRPHSRPAAPRRAVPKAPAGSWRCAPAAADARLKMPQVRSRPGRGVGPPGLPRRPRLGTTP